jgi:membrane protein DedA with SNARE-associated domain
MPPLIVPQSWIDATLAFFKDHSEFAPLICFLLGFGESIALVSLFVPSTVLFLGIGAAQSASGGSFLPLWLAGSAGAFIGDVVSYAVGRYFRDDVARMWPFTKYPDFIPKGRIVVERWGGLSIIGGKFIGGLRPFLPVAAGMMSMPWVIFLLSSAVSCLIWAGAFLAPGFGVSFFMK